ncbi:hypothetical protein L0666_16220 [Octadecabacter sp. CECT 8868]|uniref:hypothetical protein n=1 Tax=Octadecabacter algicola TaxID=2909342 RepID=UPI001F4305F0|nr:hypothetical protein [Octadecabacter algicola]MCF2906540.1 hypothetical protein [Octadecabacter algicola]
MTRKTKLFARTLTTLKTFVASLVFACAGSTVQANGFGSPSGNIRCYVNLYTGQPISDAPLVCLIFEADWDLPANENFPECDLDQTRQIILPAVGTSRAQWICHGDVFWPEPLGTISYGSQWFLFNFECEMQRNGVRCSNSGDGGFVLNRGSVSLD